MAEEFKLFFRHLAQSASDDIQSLEEAFEILVTQKIQSLDRLNQLTDNQWGRLGIPLGVETLIREGLRELQEDDASPVEEEQELRHRRGRGGGGGGAAHKNNLLKTSAERQSQDPRQQQRQQTAAQDALYPQLNLQAPENLEELWENLLIETLPPDKRDALQTQWDATREPTDKYMMFLEYSSYLRRNEYTEEDKAERKKQMKPLMQHYGIDHLDEEKSFLQTNMGIFLVFSLFLIISGFLYYLYVGVEPAVGRPKGAPHLAHEDEQL